MANKRGFKITDMERHDVDEMTDVVRRVSWRVTLNPEDKSGGVDRSGWLDLEPPTPQAQIPFDQLTEQAVKGWVNAHVDFDLDEINGALDAELETKRNPPIRRGLPW